MGGPNADAARETSRLAAAVEEEQGRAAEAYDGRLRKSGYLVKMLNTVDVAYSSNSTFGQAGGIQWLNCI